MVFSVNFDTSDFWKRAKQLEADQKQVPFAMAVLLNDAAFAARRVMTENIWPTYTANRNTNFLSASLQVQRASKGDLTVTIYDKLQRGHLYEQVHGGVVTPARGRMFAIPIKGMVRRGARGVALSDRPRNLISNKKKKVRVTSKGIWVGDKGKLKLMYLFKPQVTITKRVPLFEAFNYTVMETMRTGFMRAMAFALQTARK
jgi:hypothetical protein